MQADSRMRPRRTVRDEKSGQRNNGYGTNRRTRPALYANERRRKKGNGGDRAECNQIRCALTSSCLNCGHFNAWHGKITCAGQLTDGAGAVLTRRNRLLAMMHVMFAHCHGCARHCLRHGRFIASALRQLHGHRRRQCAAGKDRHPQQHQYGNKFSKQTRHRLILFLLASSCQ